MPLLRSSICFCLCFPRVSYRASPSFHPGLCRSAALSGLFARIGRLRCCVVVLCSLNVFGCVNGLLRSFVFLFDCDCMGCGGGGDWCGRAMSPKGAILLHSPGRKPWVICYRTFIEPRRGGTSLRRVVCGRYVVFIRWGIGLRR